MPKDSRREQESVVAVVSTDLAGKGKGSMTVEAAGTAICSGKEAIGSDIAGEEEDWCILCVSRASVGIGGSLGRQVRICARAAMRRRRARLTCISRHPSGRYRFQILRNWSYLEPSCCCRSCCRLAAIGLCHRLRGFYMSDDVCRRRCDADGGTSLRAPWPSLLLHV